jgi:mRNA interferase MazF
LTAFSTIFEAGDIVRVPFPHIERPVMVPRPALGLTPRPIGPDGLLIWTAMITNAARPDWPDDVMIPASESLGLLIPSKVRTTKIAAIEVSAAARITKLDDETWTKVWAKIRKHLGL